MSYRDHFNEYGYVVINDLVDTRWLNKMFDWWRRHKINGEVVMEDPSQVHGVHGPFEVMQRDRFIESADEVWPMHDEVGDRIENILDISMVPTYSTGRVYYEGSSMDEHTDRDPCEISCTIPIAFDIQPWPIRVKSSKGDRPVVLNIGQGLIYRGCDLPHYRPALHESTFVVQHFFHWCDSTSRRGQAALELERKQRGNLRI